MSACISLPFAFGCVSGVVRLVGWLAWGWRLNLGVPGWSFSAGGGMLERTVVNRTGGDERTAVQAVEVADASGSTVNPGPASPTAPPPSQSGGGGASTVPGLFVLTGLLLFRRLSWPRGDARVVADGCTPMSV